MSCVDRKQLTHSLPTPKFPPLFLLFVCDSVYVCVFVCVCQGAFKVKIHTVAIHTREVHLDT